MEMPLVEVVPSVISSLSLLLSCRDTSSIGLISVMKRSATFFSNAETSRFGSVLIGRCGMWAAESQPSVETNDGRDEVFDEIEGGFGGWFLSTVVVSDVDEGISGDGAGAGVRNLDACADIWEKAWLLSFSLRLRESLD